MPSVPPMEPLGSVCPPLGRVPWVPEGALVEPLPPGAELGAEVPELGTEPEGATVGALLDDGLLELGFLPAVLPSVQPVRLRVRTRARAMAVKVFIDDPPLKIAARVVFPKASKLDRKKPGKMEMEFPLAFYGSIMYNEQNNRKGDFFVMKKLTVKKNVECMACLACVQACSNAFYKTFHQDLSCIQVVAKPGGGAKPVTCIQCGKCARTCEHEAITQNPKTGVYMINKKKCVSCGKCKEACPMHVLVLPTEGPASKCIACGICAKACPMELLEVVEK